MNNGMVSVNYGFLAGVDHLRFGDPEFRARRCGRYVQYDSDN